MTHQSKKKFDVIVLGSGIAGISIASELSEHLDVCVLEKERLISYHSTGRSLAFYLESYGNEVIRQLTSASKDFFPIPTASLTSILPIFFIPDFTSKQAKSAFSGVVSN